MIGFKECNVLTLIPSLVSLVGGDTFCRSCQLLAGWRRVNEGLLAFITFLGSAMGNKLFLLFLLLFLFIFEAFGATLSSVLMTHGRLEGSNLR